MRGFVQRRMRRRLVVGALFALFFVVVCRPAPAQADASWKEAVADIEATRDSALSDLHNIGTMFTEFLEDEPTAGEATEAYYRTLEDLEAVGRDAVEEIDALMDEFPDRRAVQDAGSLAKGLINAAQAFAESYATFQLNQYLEQLEEPPSPPTTTTTAPPATTTTTAAPTTTTTVVPTTTTPVVTTTTVPPVVTTTTAPPVVVTTTTSPTTTTTVPERTGTTTTTSTTLVPDGEGALPPDGSDRISPADPTRERTLLTLGGGDEDYLAAGPGAASSTGFFMEPGLSVSLSRVLEPLLPAPVTDVVVSPLFMLELLWRAISSSGQGLVAPISLLLFSLLSLLRDRRRVGQEPAESAG